ncbi:hypothetical protein GCM10025857_29740 [Alicyclobacillus contaminans]|uniref:response regulator n=1 Tax=Alicyclobacillus contaminans TaxID=392016 RepID=UPI000408111C|nr:response regulator [Alicyclobacillus contaminans]GMA51617.1 hypothetical protein GCM10025857_29740 [Alicyclobacillus contaminans]
MGDTPILIVDDEQEVTTFFKHLLAGKQCQVHIANDAAAVDRFLSEGIPFRLALVDLKLPDANGLDILSKIKQRTAACDVVMMTGYSTVKSAVAAIQAGARDYLEKPFENIDELESLLDQFLQRQSSDDESLQKLAAQYGIICAPGSPMHAILAIVRKIARSRSTFSLKVKPVRARN